MQVGEGSSKLIRTDTRSRIIHHHKIVPHSPQPTFFFFSFFFLSFFLSFLSFPFLFFFFFFSFLFFFSKNVRLTRGYTHRIFSFIFFFSSQMSLLVNFISYILLSLSCSAWLEQISLSICTLFDFPLQTINISQFGLTARKWQNCKSRFSTRHAPGMS